MQWLCSSIINRISLAPTANLHINTEVFGEDGICWPFAWTNKSNKAHHQGTENISWIHQNYTIQLSRVFKQTLIISVGNKNPFHVSSHVRTSRSLQICSDFACQSPSKWVDAYRQNCPGHKRRQIKTPITLPNADVWLVVMMWVSWNECEAKEGRCPLEEYTVNGDMYTSEWSMCEM
jgi:hypothetical protein